MARNHHLPPRSYLTPEELKERLAVVEAYCCASCGGLLSDNARIVLYGGPSDGDPESWVGFCDCPAPCNSSACEVNPF